MRKKTNFTVRLSPATRSELERCAAGGGVTPATLARQFILAGVQAAEREENLVQHVAAEVAAEIKPALAELSRVAAAALAAREFVDLYGPGYLTICEIAKRLEVPVHKIEPKNKNPEQKS